MHVRGLWRNAALLAGGILALAGCSPKEHDAVVASIANEPITVSEYERQYLKNSPNRDSAAAMPMEARRRFLDLIVNYKLKLADAKRLSLDQQPAVRNEIRQYEGGLAASYITEREVVSPVIRRMYDRRGEEIRASHILLTLATGASPTDSALTYALANRIIDSLKQGVPFETLAMRHSVDPSVKQNGGDLYYFTAGMMIPAFEDAVYALQTGQVGLVRTPYGLHIVKVVDRRPTPGELRASHIMIRFPSMQPTPQDTAAAFAKAVAIQDSLAKGIDFAALATRNSGDPGSAPAGGDLGWFSRRRWVLSFDEAVFRLQPGQVSGIVRTPYGYHLIKCTGQRPRKSFEDSRQELQQLYQQTRFQDDLAAYMGRLKKSVGLVRDNTVIERFLAQSDTTKTTRDSAWAAGMTPAIAHAVVLSARGQQMTLDSLVSAINQRTDLSVTPIRRETFPPVVDKIEDQFVWTAAADSFATLYPEFRGIMNEYRDGVLLYQMEQENVWNKLAPSDSVLRQFYAKNHERFSWPERVQFTELRMANERTAAKVANMLKAGKTPEELALEDSIRMAQSTHFSVVFRQNSTTLHAAAMKTLAAAAAQVKQDPSVAIQLAVPTADTGKGSTAIATARRLEALKKYLTANLRVPAGRITGVVRPPAIAEETDKEGKAEERLRQFDLTITGRQPLLLAKPEVSLLAPAADERAAHADSLAPGTWSAPFVSRGLHTIVRLEKREPPREKTFEEAQAEVSGLYQDTESKRLEDQWVKDLHARYPVVVNTETLREAFAPVKQ